MIYQVEFWFWMVGTLIMMYAVQAIQRGEMVGYVGPNGAGKSTP
jgi:ABC-type cobalamin/Fe3+-siderophores transport system ATPase subunit